MRTGVRDLPGVQAQSSELSRATVSAELNRFAKISVSLLDIHHGVCAGLWGRGGYDSVLLQLSSVESGASQFRSWNGGFWQGHARKIFRFLD